MQTVVFEVEPKPGHEDHYFNRAMALKPVLETYDGMLFLDRYRSMENNSKILSFQRWVSDEAIVEWRGDNKHHGAQKAGRNIHFADYRIRISHIVARQEKDADVARYDVDVSDEARLFILAIGQDSPCLEGGETFKSVNIEGSHMTIRPVESLAEAEELMAQASANPAMRDVMLCLSHRDYTMHKREEAPQEFEPA